MPGKEKRKNSLEQHQFPRNEALLTLLSLLLLIGLCADNYQRHQRVLEIEKIVDAATTNSTFMGIELGLDGVPAENWLDFIDNPLTRNRIVTHQLAEAIKKVDLYHQNGMMLDRTYSSIQDQHMSAAQAALLRLEAWQRADGVSLNDIAVFAPLLEQLNETQIHSLVETFSSLLRGMYTLSWDEYLTESIEMDVLNLFNKVEYTEVTSLTAAAEQQKQQLPLITLLAIITSGLSLYTLLKSIQARKAQKALAQHRTI